MSIEAINWALNLTLAPSQKLVTIVLANYANDDNTCWPSFETLSKKTSLSRRSVIRQIISLKELGVLAVVKRLASGANMYKLNLSASDFVSPAEGENEQPAGDIVAPPSDIMTLASGDMVSLPSDTMSPPSDNLTPGLVTQCHPNHHITITKPSLEEKKDAQKENAQIIKINFEIFWQAYRKHKDRARAFKTFSKIKPDAELLHKMLDAIENQHTERIYQQRHTGWAADWKHPATWLNGENWNDEVNLDENYWRNSKRKSGQKTESLVERSRRERAERRGEATPNCYLDSITVEPNKQLTGERD